MSFSCFYCNEVTDLVVPFEAKTFACPSCKRVYIENEGEFKFKDKFDYNFNDGGLELGAIGSLKGKEYKVTGIILKKAYDRFYWSEYVLCDENQEFVFLSEANGHWIFLREIEEAFEVENHPGKLTYNDMTLRLYDYTNAEIVSAKGYFDFDVSIDKIQTFDYINPPYTISIEKAAGVQAAFLGEHISKSEVKKAFKVPTLPSRNGIGLVQPFVFDLRNMALIFCVVVLLIVVSHWLLNSNRVEKEILDVDIPFENYTNKDYITPSFELRGSSAPLSISVYSSVDNSWANLQIALVNEKTGEETYANKDIEYYHGYTDGENWAEGSTSEDFNLCGIGAGKYHLSLTPMKAAEDTTISSMHVKASWNKPSGRNVWMIFIFMGVFIVLMFYLGRYFETKRWEDSDYSPYAETE